MVPDIHIVRVVSNPPCMYLHPLCINTEGYIFEYGLLKICVPEGRKCEDRKGGDNSKNKIEFKNDNSIQSFKQH
jgi:hypothetical protein